MTVFNTSEAGADALRALAKAHDLDEPGSPDLARRLQGQPLVVDITGTPHPRVIGFLDCLAIKGRAPRTIETYAQRLDTVLKHLGTSGKHALSLMVLTPTDIHFLREQIVGAPPFNGKQEAATWNLTVAALRSYFQWEKHHGELFVCDMSDARGARGTGDLEYIRECVHETKLKVSSNRARPLAPEVVAKLIAELPPPYDLMARWEVRTGLRAFEVSGLQLTHYAALDRQWTRGERVASVKTTRKGQKQSPFYAVDHLRGLSRHYIEIRRPALVARFGNSPALFLDGEGQPVKSLNYIKAVSAAAERIGIPHRSHSLRATFGRKILDEANKMKDRGTSINPLLVTKDLMDHVRVDTTIKYVEEVKTALLDIAELFGHLER